MSRGHRRSAAGRPSPGSGSGRGRFSIGIVMTKFCTAGTVMRACMITVGLPARRGPLKKVNGELTTRGSWPSSPIATLACPVPTIAPGQRLRASWVVASSSEARLADRQTGGVEPAVAVEVKDQLLQRRRNAAVHCSQVCFAVEVDRCVAAARQGRRPEAAVRGQHQVADLDQGGIGRAREDDAADQNPSCQKPLQVLLHNQASDPFKPAREAILNTVFCNVAPAWPA